MLRKSCSRLPCARGVSVWIGLVLVFVLTAGPTVAAEEDQDIQALQRTSRAFARITKAAKPAVVFIKVEKTLGGGPTLGPFFEFNDPFDLFSDEFYERFFRRRFPERRQPREFKQMGQGSGFIISADGSILTNHHVVGDADRITVNLADGREFPANLVGTDPRSDVAVIQIEGENLPVLPLGNSDTLAEGEWVIAIGNPFGLSHTTTIGVVSATGRNVVGIADYEDFIQTDAAINPGNSGGPLINIQGEAVGINTAIFSRSGGYMGIGFAIPINMAKTIAQQLIDTGKVVRGYLGVSIQALTPDLAKSFDLEHTTGVVVAEVNSDSPAEKAGLQSGDVIVELNDTSVDGVGTLRNQIALLSPGTQVELGIIRRGEKRTITVEIGELPATQMASGTPTNVTEKFGFAVQDLTPELARQFGYETGSGVLITNVMPGSPAALAGLRQGTLIREVNRKKITNTGEFREALAASEASSAVLLLVQDGQHTRFVALQSH